MLSTVRDQYLILYADCFLVRGHTRTMICDISRRKMFFIGNPFYDLLLQLKTNTIGDVCNMLEDETDYTAFEDFANYLLSHELGLLVDDTSVFPPIDLVWDSPYAITNALIDLRDKIPDFKKIFSELEQLDCPYIQIRAYQAVGPDVLRTILPGTAGTGFRNIQFLLKYTDRYALEQYMDIVREYPVLSLIFHSVPPEDCAALQGRYSRSEIQFLTQVIDSCQSCGVINKDSFLLVDLQGFIENIRFNGCLNRKISIDEHGNIRNCPSMQVSYGNIEDTYLKDVVDREDFRSMWSINKDAIEVCKDCEFRYICMDCRAYTRDPGNLLSKPAKCSYDPYVGKWK